METPTPRNQTLIAKLWDTARTRNHKPISVYFKLRDLHTAGKVRLNLADLTYLAELLGYKPAWAQFKATELNLGEDNPDFQPFFDGVVRFVNYATVRRDHRDWGAGEARSAAGVCFRFVVPPERVEETSRAIIPGCHATVTGPWSAAGQLLLVSAVPYWSFQA